MGRQVCLTSPPTPHFCAALARSDTIHLMRQPEIQGCLWSYQQEATGVMMSGSAHNMTGGTNRNRPLRRKPAHSRGRMDFASGVGSAGS